MRDIAKKWIKTAFFLGIILFGVSVFFNRNTNDLNVEKARKVPYSDFIKEIDKGDIQSVVVKGYDLYGHENNSSVWEKSFGPFSSQMANDFSKKGTAVSFVDDEKSLGFLDIILALFPFIIPVAFAVLFFLFQGRAIKKIGLPGGRSKMKWISKEDNDITFKDVAGADEAKEELKEVVDFLKEPTKYQLLGGKIPKGVLLVGPPGTGKTLLAKAVAGEADVPFATIAGSDFIELFVGMGASRVREMFSEGRKKAPCIIFIDEIDSVGKKRGDASFSGAGNDEREQTLNQFLVEMDGFASQEGIIIIAATNRSDVLDPALLRPGRFDRQVTVPNPDVKGREAIIKVHLKDRPLAEDVDIKTIARGTPGFSGADLANIVNEAALLASKLGRKSIDMYTLEQAKDKVMMGPERRSMVMTDKDREATAYHEAGHAICGLLMPEGDPLHKVTIVPRGQALGLTFSLPIEDKLAYTIEYLEARLVMTMGGRAAEDIIYGARKVSNGASGDIQQATQLATAMVTQWGMSEKIGMISYNLGNYTDSTSEYTKQTIEMEIKKFIDTSYVKAKTLLTENRDKLEILTKALLEKETLDGKEAKELLQIS